jgi:hypothetical protein
MGHGSGAEEGDLQSEGRAHAKTLRKEVGVNFYVY